MDGLSGAATVAALVDISAKIASLIFQYSVAVKGAKEDIERVREKINGIHTILGKIQQLLGSHDRTHLAATRELSKPLKGCIQQLEVLNKQLDPGKTRKAMSRVGVRALKWPFTSKEVEKIVASLESYEQSFLTALQVDQTSLMFRIDQKSDLNRLPIAEGASFDSHADEHLARCLTNTRVELQRHIMEWAEDVKAKPIFWLNGMAGTGKSTIARTIAQSFADRNQLAASFFFKRGEGYRGNASRFFTTIAKDLAARIPNIAMGVQRAVDSNLDIFERNLKDQFEKLILEPLKEIGQTLDRPAAFIIVIDALDECEREQDIYAVLQLLSRLKDVDLISIRILITSRPELPIRLGFKKVADGTYQDFILEEVRTESITHDITLFFEHQFQEIRAERCLSPGWPAPDQIEALVRMAIPLFIFAATICRYVRDSRDSPLERLDIVLSYQKRAISQLDMTYLPILEQLIQGQDKEDQKRWAQKFQSFVGSIIILESPLSITSLSHLLHTRKDDTRCYLDSLHSVLSIRDDEDAPVKPLHLSFRDFLLDPNKMGNSPFWIDEREVHKKLALQCLQLLSTTLKQDICDLKTPGILTSEIDRLRLRQKLPPEVQYACRYWFHHFKESHGRAPERDVHTFLQDRILYWMEAMSLIGEISEVIHIIYDLQSHIKGNDEMSNFIHDAHRFVLKYRFMIENAPLQIYISGILFAPKETKVRKKFEDKIPQWVHRYPKVDQKWNLNVQVLEGPGSWVTSVVLSPDGKLIASGSNDKVIRVWDTNTGGCKSELEGHESNVNAIVFSPDSQLLASVSLDNIVRLWDTTTGECKSELRADSNSLVAIMFSPDSKLLFSCSIDNIVQLWDATTGDCQNELKGHTNNINLMVFSPGAKLLASISTDNTILLWDTNTGGCKREFKGLKNSVDIITFSPDGKLLACASDKGIVQLWDTTTSDCKSRLLNISNHITAIVFSPNGKLLASSSTDTIVQLWNTSTGDCKSKLQGHGDDIYTLAFSPDGKLLASGSDDNTIRLWDTTTGDCKSELHGHGSWIRSVAFSPDSNFLASGSLDGTVRLWDVAIGNYKSEIQGHNSWVSTVVFSPNNQLLASSSNDGAVRIWDSTTGDCKSRLQGHKHSTVVFSPDSKLLALDLDDNTIQIWDTATGYCKNELKVYISGIRTIAFSPDSKLLASGSSDGIMRLWDAKTGKCESELHSYDSWVRFIMFSPNGKLLASWSLDSTVQLWDVSTGTCKSKLQREICWTRFAALAFSPDSKFIASVLLDNTVQLWDVSTGYRKIEFKGHSDVITSIVFSPNGKLLASSANDGTVRIWDIATGDCNKNFEIPDIKCLSFSSDDSCLYTNRGALPLSSISLDTISGGSPQNSVFIQDNWICNNKLVRFLWLPPEYRPSAVVVQGNLVAIGCPSGKVYFIEIEAPDNV